MSRKSLSIDHPRVQKIKIEFERVRNYRFKRKVTMSFKKLFDYFQSDNSMTDLAVLLEVSRQYVEHLYNKYFFYLFRKKPMERRKARFIKKRFLEKKDLKKTLPRDSSTSRIVEIAKSLSLKTESIPYNCKKLAIRQKEIKINGKICSIKSANKLFLAKNRTPYVRFECRSYMIGRSQFVIFHIVVENYPEKILIIPANVILQSSASRKGWMIYIPLGDNTHRKQTDWRYYQDRWDLISQTQPAS